MVIGTYVKLEILNSLPKATLIVPRGIHLYIAI